MLLRWRVLLLWAHCSNAFQLGARRFHRLHGRTRASYADGSGSESNMPPEGAAYWESMSESASLKGPATLSFDFLLPEGWAARVDLWSEADAAPAAAAILAEYSDSSATLEDLTLALQSHWARAVPSVFAGPSPDLSSDSKAEAWKTSVVAGATLGDTGLVLEVAPSTVAGAGLGLFVRKGSADYSDVTLFSGQPVCGFGEPGCVEPLPKEQASDAAPLSTSSGHSIALGLSSHQSEVFYDGLLMPIEAALQKSGAKHVKGHISERNANDRLVSLTPSPGYCEAWIPFESPSVWAAPVAGPRPQPPGAMSIGQAVNDLAVCCSSDGTVSWRSGAASYAAASAAANVVEIRQNFGADSNNSPGDASDTLVPMCPILAFTRALTFDSHLPMELGCAYGIQYWEDAIASEAMKTDISTPIRAK